MNMQMINSSMSICTVEDSIAKVMFFLKTKNNFDSFFSIEANYFKKGAIDSFL
jgi:hypothetical protein